MRPRHGFRTAALGVVLTAAFAASASADAPADAHADAKKADHLDFATAKTKATAAGKNILVDFSAPG